MTKTAFDEKFIRMTQAPVRGLILRMAVPTIVSMLISAAYNMADTFFVGQLNNTSATGAIGIAFPLMSLLFSSNMLMQNISSALRASLLSMARQGIFFFPAILILPSILGLTGLQLVQPAADLCAFLLTIPLVGPVLRDLKQREKEEAEFRVPDTAGAVLFDTENV